MEPCRVEADGKFIVDSIHGDIHLTGQELEVVDTASFQRLRHLKQLAMSQMVYPNATHTRFAHSLGVLAIMAKVTNVAKNANLIDPKQEKQLRLAALLHDVGHYPYSHLMEKIDRVRLTEEQIEPTVSTVRSLDKSRYDYPEHEIVGTYIIAKQKDLIKALGDTEMSNAVIQLVGPRQPTIPQWSKLVHSSLDMDRLDYLLRDSQATGVPYGQIDINYLLNNLRVSPGGMLGIAERALPAAEQFLLARFFMHRTVYYHKTTFGMEEVCRHLFRRLRDGCKYGIPSDGNDIKRLVESRELYTFTDAYVDEIIQKAAGDTSNDEVTLALARSIQRRQPPKLLKPVNVLRRTMENNVPHDGTIFKMNCRNKLGQLAQDAGIALGQFIICETPPLTLEKRGPLITAQQAPNMDWKEEEELIKIFVPDEDEPKSLVDIPYSLLSKCGGLSFQSFRLYVVCEETSAKMTVEEMKDRVKTWDKP
jgi:hypothetical protein